MKLNPADMLLAATEASDLLKAIANPHRLMIVCQLIGQDRSVSELAEFLKIRPSTVSQHLAILRKDGIVLPRRDGQTIWYSIRSAAAKRLVGTMYAIYCARGRSRPAGRRAARAAHHGSRP